jgi:glutamate-1-semialdehyde 2,1-aminomutase
MVRFTNSGTEACMGMLRLVRAFTKREKVYRGDRREGGREGGRMGGREG